MFYKEMIEKYYGIQNLASITDNSNEAYNIAKKNKEKYLDTWTNFVAEVKTLEGVKKIRDTYYSSYPDTGKLTIGINNNVEEGLTFNLSFRTMQMGIYYCHYTEKSKLPIIEQSKKSIDGSEYITTYNHLSYFPFNTSQEEFSWLLLNVADDFFPEFKLFNNTFAGYKAKNVVIQTTVFKAYDYFRVFFDDAMDGIS